MIIIYSRYVHNIVDILYKTEIILMSFKYKYVIEITFIQYSKHLNNYLKKLILKILCKNTLKVYWKCLIQ